MTQPYDLCANSVTLSERHRLLEIDRLYERHQASGNLYLGGSVGLLQPSLKVRDATAVGLKSDLDLFYLCRDFPPSSSDQAFLRAVAELPDDLDISLHVAAAVTLDQPTYSATLDDLSAPLTRPLRQSFPFTTASTAPAYESKSIVTYAIRMLATALVDSYVGTHRYANLAGNVIACDSSTRVKSALVFLRLPCYATLGARYSYRTLLAHAQDGGFQGICSAQLVRELIEHREQVDSERPLPEFELAQLFCGALARHTDLPLSTPPLEVAQVAIERCLSGTTSLDQRHRLLLAHSLWLLDPGPAQEDFAQQQLDSCHDEPLKLHALLHSAYQNRDLKRGRSHCGELLGLCLHSVTDRVAALVAQALEKSHDLP